MLKYFVYILLFVCFFSGVGHAQEERCVDENGLGYSVFNIPWDNYLLVSFTKIAIQEVNGTKYLYFDLNFKRKGEWYPESTLTPDDIELDGENPVVQGVNLYFDYNTSVLEGEKNGSLEMVSCAQIQQGSSFFPLNSETNCYQMSCEVSTVYGGIKLGAINMALRAAANRHRFFVISKDTEFYCATYRWKIKAGATGNTEVKLKVGRGVATEFYSLAKNDKNNTDLGICTTGDLNISIGGDTPTLPTISNLTGDALACQGDSKSYSGTVDDASATLSWKVKSSAGADITNTAVQGGTIASTTASTTFTWATTAPVGTDSVCLIATNANGTAEKCIPVSVKAIPALVLNASASADCAGEPITLTATSGLTSYQWSQGSTILATNNNNTYSPNLPTSGATVKYSVKATKDGCSATAEKEIQIYPLPIANIDCEVANGHVRNVGKFAKGDRIVYRAQNPNTTTYDYSWSDGINTVNGTEFEIPSATASAYNVTLTVENKTTHCSATKTVNLTLDNSCGITNLAVAGTDENRICQGGLCRLTATVTTACDGNSVIGYSLYKGNVKLDSVGITNNALSHVFNVFESGNFTVKVYTLAGMLTKDINISSKGFQPDAVNAADNLYVQSGHSTILIANSTNGTITDWLWEPQNKIAGNNAQQYATTSDLTVNTPYYVYGTDQNECMTMDSTKVEISNNALNVDIIPAVATICKRGSVTLTAKVSGGTPPYTYEWTNDSYTENADYTHQSTRFKDPGSASAGSTYYRVVMVKDASNPALTGSAMVSVKVVADEEPQLNINGGNPLCQGGQLTVEKTSGANPLSYTWFIKSQDGNMVTSAGSSYTFANRGDYQVWVQGNTANCSSDTAKAAIHNLKVNGFELAWTNEPTNYQLGADIIASAEATDGTSPYTFNWNNLAGGSMTGSVTTNPNTYKVLGASQNTYTFKVTVSDGNSCQQTLEKTVTATGGLQLAVSGSTIQCNGGAVALTATASEGSSPYTFTWYAPGNEGAPYQTTVATGSSDIFVRGAFNNNDKIVVKVSDNAGLNRYDTLTVTTSVSSAPVVNAGDDITIARNSSTILIGEVNYGTVNTWHWSPVGDLASANEATKQYAQTKNISSQKTFSVYAVDNTGCVSYPDDIVVNVSSTNTFAATIDDPGTLCIGNNVNLAATLNPASVSVENWEWIESSGHLTNVNGASPTFNALASGNSNVFLRVTANVGGETLTATASRALSVLNSVAPILDLEGLSDDNSICSADALKVVSTNTPPVVLTTCQWYVGGVLQANNTTTFKPEVDGTSVLSIRVRAQSNVGCPAVEEVAKEITIYPKPKLEWDANSPTAIAVGADVELQANLTGDEKHPNYTYSWSHSGSTSGITFTDLPAVQTAQEYATSKATTTAVAGVAYAFQVYVTDGNGCKSVSINRTVSVSGDILTVNLTSEHGDFCAGGAALLKAEVLNPDPAVDYTYAWTKNGSPLAGVTGSQYLETMPQAGDQYAVTVTGGSKTGTSAPLALAATTATAPVLSAVDQNIPSNTRTVLVATPSVGAVITDWQWNPVDKIATNESTLAHPYTTLLDGPTTHVFTVYAVDAQGCVTKPINVNVKTLNASPEDPDDDEHVFAKVIPEDITICAGNELELQTRVWSSVSAVNTFSWEPSLHLSASNVANPVFNPSKALLSPGTYSYVVKVTRGTWLTYARTQIHVVNGTLPVLALDKDNSGNACAGGNIVMKVNNAGSVTIDKYIWFIDGEEDSSVTGNTYTWPAVTSESQHTVKVIAVSTGNCRSNMIAMDSVVKPAVELRDLSRTDSCGLVILVAKSDAVATYTWEITAGADKIQKSQGVTADTVYLKPLANLTTASLPYTVKVSVQPQNGGCQAKGEISGKLFFRPKVALDDWTPTGEALGLPYIMAEKNTNVVIPISAGASDYTSSNAVATWETFVGGTLTNRTPTQVTLAGIVADDTVKITVKNLEDQNCRATDSIPVYLYPEAPGLTIDTVDNSLVKIGLRLEGEEGSKFTIWSRKWDPYCLTSIFTGNQVYVKELTAIDITNKLWKEPHMDTLEFYYATGGRTIQGRTWNSKTTSDTVGYYLSDLHVNSNASLTSFNMVTVYFDFAEMGYPTTEELFKKNVKTDISYIRKWLYAQQDWYYSRMIVIGSNQNVAQPFALEPGMLLNIQPRIEMQLLQYGKLPSRFRINYSYTTTTPIEHTFMLPQRMDLEQVSDIFALHTQLMYVRKWNFATQQWDYARKVGTNIIGNAGNFTLIPLMGLQFQLGTTTTKVWE